MLPIDGDGLLFSAFAATGNPSTQKDGKKGKNFQFSFHRVFLLGSEYGYLI